MLTYCSDFLQTAESQKSDNGPILDDLSSNL